MREADERYFERIESRLDEAFDLAQRAKASGGDPEPEVEIPTARDMADRVENILGIDGVAERVRELEGQMSREEAALELVEDFVEGTVGDYESREGKVEGAVRTAVALLTEGVVAAPIEGIDRVELLENDDGTEFINVYYAGPIRSAGGTAQALSVLVADYARALLDIDQYKARGDEVERYAEEIALYDKETGLQYSPKDEETKFIAEHMPIMLDGEATGDEEVSGFRDLERVDTNSARGGMCLVLAEGIALKAPKIQRYTKNLDEVDWPWLQDLIDGTYYDDESGDAGDEAESDAGDDAGADTGDDGDGESEAADGPNGPPRVEKSQKFLRDLIAGRPVFSHPCESGGFRLRYGRARNHGFATAGVHPATMHLVDDFLATGTQIKTERPGKAAGVVPVDSIEGPTVRLANGDVRQVDDPEEALEIRNGVERILDLGEYLVNYGEFVENNHPLAPASYTVEWWRGEFDDAGADLQALRDSPHVDLDDPSAEEALEWATEYDAPLHPAYTYVWHDISVAAFDELADAVADGDVEDGTLHVPRRGEVRETVETLLKPHHQTDDELLVRDYVPFLRSLGIDEELDRTWTLSDLSDRALTWGTSDDTVDAGQDAEPTDRDDDRPLGTNAIEAVNEVAPFTVRERAPTRVGNRMGRPEKSESRDLSPAVHTLFPVGEAGGSQRSVAEGAKHAPDMRSTPGRIEAQVGTRECTGCGEQTFETRCPDCGERTEPYYFCPDCEQELEPDDAGRVHCDHCEVDGTSVEFHEIDLKAQYWDAMDEVGERENSFEILKGVKGLSSTNKTPEPMAKGVLRAKHGVTAFKDGTVRYDMTDLPVTAVRATELDVTADQLRALGYETDVHGDELRHDDQLVELKVQDVVLSDGAAEHMLKTADFVDDLLESYYGLEPFYEMDEREELVGELVFGMAPHTSAATVGRVVGFTSAAVGYAHPYFHAAKRRNCFHPETKIWFEDESGATHYDEIRSFVEERLDPESAEEDDFGTLVQELDGEVSVPSLADDGTLVRKPVEAVSRHRSTEHLVEIETRGGREITVTPDHEVHVFDAGVTSKRANELTPSDSLVTPAEIDVAGSEIRLDLLEELLVSDEVPNESLMVKGLEKDELYDLFTAVLEDDWNGQFYPLKSTAEFLGLTKKGLSNYVYRESVPASLLIELLGSPDAVVENVPDDVALGMKRDCVDIDRFVEVDSEFATLLGYYTAEGFAREQSTPKGTIHQTTISGVEMEAREFFEDTLRSALGVEAYRENHAKVTVSGRLPRVLFESVLDCGTGAEDKRVPACIFDAPDELVGSYLGGYFSGDGMVDKNSLMVQATTVSRELKEDLLALLTRIGITAKVTTTEPAPLVEKFPDFYNDDDESMSAVSFVINVSSSDAVRFAERVDLHLSRKRERLAGHVESIEPRARRIFDGGSGEYYIDEITEVSYVESDYEHTYCLTVEDTHSLIANDTSQKQCDGDEDCVMLLLDGLLNFSKAFLPDQRGGKMDAPLVMSSRIDPSEIDDEAHNMDIMWEYPTEFYEATREMADPEEVEDIMTIAEETLGTEREYTDFAHTHDTTDIHMGPALSAYKTLGSMQDKMDAQLHLSRKLRAVDETDVAERIIEYHFLPDLIGNLRAFSRQETRCLDCGEKYRRMPLTGDCRECGGRVNLTVHQGSVNKYMQTALMVAEEFGCRPYTVQRLEKLEKALSSVFEDDTNRQTGIADFM
ncbi:LAGLIDADG family homing endonuclease [Haloarchaeobius iranensis]|uniref:DNA polymerase II large subunit n=1 Tax=Haloarchaeobius iranensis TaxID=996166 RepID=A0A1G9SN20_9EURY|nr:LAGLIDADG family homing endonuclease [Haloarchaeobius iranensis]SDM36700.1 DNA polymerase II large subunit [Haloarchaeobius iranensis]